jgi:hypothetical protein
MDDRLPKFFKTTSIRKCMDPIGCSVGNWNGGGALPAIRGGFYRYYSAWLPCLAFPRTLVQRRR